MSKNSLMVHRFACLILASTAGCSAASALISHNGKSSGSPSALSAAGGDTGGKSAADMEVREADNDLQRKNYKLFFIHDGSARHELFDKGDVSLHERVLQKKLIALEDRFAKAIGGRVADILGDGSRVGKIDADGLAWGKKVIELCEYSTRGDDEMATYQAAYKKAKKKRPEVLRFSGTFNDGNEYIDIPMKLAECELRHATIADESSDDYPYPNIHEGDSNACGEDNPKLACEESNSFTVTYYNQAQFYVARAAARRGARADVCRELLGKASEQLKEFHDWYKDASAHGKFKPGITYKTRYMGKLSEKQILANLKEMTSLVDDRQDSTFCAGKGDSTASKFDDLTSKTEQADNTDKADKADKTEAANEPQADDADAPPPPKKTKKTKKKTKKHST